MKKSGKLAKIEDMQLGYVDDILENSLFFCDKHFVSKKEMDSTLKPWQGGFRFRSLSDYESRVSLYNMTDRGDRFKLQVKTLGIEKYMINFKAAGNSVEISAEISEKEEEKINDYIYISRSGTSSYPRIAIQDKMVVSKIDDMMNNGKPIITLPFKKRNPTGSRQYEARVEVK